MSINRLFLACLIASSIIPLLKSMFDIVLLNMPKKYIDNAESIETKVSILCTKHQ